MTGPPPLIDPPPFAPRPAAKSMKIAAGLNLFLPGAGLFYLGKKGVGAALAGAFLLCFLAEVGIFIVSYLRYFALAGGDLMKDDNLERIGKVFPSAWLIAFAGAGLVIYLVSMALFSWAKRGLQGAIT